MLSKPTKKTRKPTVAALKKRAQALANRYARLRDCPNGTAACISCGEYKSFAEGDGGHFIPTTSGAVRFDERNINFQCVKCNRFLHGDQGRYLVGMEHKYGRAVVDELLAQVGALKAWKTWELEEIIDYYKKKIASIST